MGTRRGFRLARAAMFAAVCVPFAAAGHVLMSGAGVPGWTLVAGAALTCAAGWAAARRERGRTAVTLAAVGAQLALHALFALGQAARSGPGAGLAHRWAAALLCGGPPMPGPASGAAIPGMPGMAGMPGPPGVCGTDSPAGMLLAHLAAATLCGLWLAYGERAAGRLARTVGARLHAPAALLRGAPPLPEPARQRPAGDRTRRDPRILLTAHAITTRGPPRHAAAAPAA